MKTFWLLCICCMACWPVRMTASVKREVEHPAFVTANTLKLEITRIISTDEQTQIDAILYGRPGEMAVVSPDTYLCAAGKKYPLREAEHLSIGGLSMPESVPESGRMPVTFSFAPVPADVHAVDFVEKEAGWTIWGLQLTAAEPYVYVPDFLQVRPVETEYTLPDPQVEYGKAVVNGYLLGYDPRMDVEVELRCPDWLSGETLRCPVPVTRDGSFHLEADLLTACGAVLQINKARLDLFLAPGGEISVYIHLPRLSTTAAHRSVHRNGTQPKVWFDGAYAALNTELALREYPLPPLPFADEDERPAGASAETWETLMQHLADKVEKRLRRDKKTTKTFQEYIRMNWQVCLGVFRAADRSFSDKVMNFPLASYSLCYQAFLHARKQTGGNLPSTWTELEEVRGVKQPDDVRNPEIRRYVQARMENLRLASGRMQAVSRSVTELLDPALEGKALMETLTAPHRGRVLLMDFWATWCAPCRKSMRAIRLMKEKPEAREADYVYLTPPSSPEAEWKQAVKDIHGMHYRLTEAQWNYLCRTYGISGIPGYLILNREGKLVARYIGFPGMDVLLNSLKQAGE